MLVLCSSQICTPKKDWLSKIDYQAPPTPWLLCELCNKRWNELMAQLKWLIAEEEAVSCTGWALGGPPAMACSILTETVAFCLRFPRADRLSVWESETTRVAQRSPEESTVPSITAPVPVTTLWKHKDPSRSHSNARRCDGDGGLRARWYGNVRPRCVSLTALTVLLFQHTRAALLSCPSVILKANIALMSLVQGVNWPSSRTTVIILQAIITR